MKQALTGISFVRSLICQPLDGLNCHSFAKVAGDPKRLHLQIIQLLARYTEAQHVFLVKKKTGGVAMVFAMKIGVKV